MFICIIMALSISISIFVQHQQLNDMKKIFCMKKANCKNLDLLYTTSALYNI